MVGIDDKLTYTKVAYALAHLNRPADAAASSGSGSGASRIESNRACMFISTNQDSTLPTAGHTLPGAGSCVAMLATASGRTPINMGKPQTIMLDLAVEKLVSPAHLRVRARLSFPPPSMTLYARSAQHVAHTFGVQRAFVFPCVPRLASPHLLTRLPAPSVPSARAGARTSAGSSWINRACSWSGTASTPTSRSESTARSTRCSSPTPVGSHISSAPGHGMCAAELGWPLLDFFAVRSLTLAPIVCVVALSRLAGIHTLDDALESGVLSTYSLGNVTQLLE